MKTGARQGGTNAEVRGAACSRATIASTTVLRPSEGASSAVVLEAADDAEVARPICVGAAFRPGRPRAGLDLVRMLVARNWGQSCLVVDLTVLYLASSAALLTGSGKGMAARGWFTVTFPLLVLALLQTRRRSDERLHRSVLDTVADVFVVVSVAILLLIATDSAIGDTRSTAFAVPLWLFSLGLLLAARLALLSVHRDAVQVPAFATPTLILGGGDIARRLVDRLVCDRQYGLRPVGILDADSVPRLEELSSSGIPILGGPEELSDAVARTGARHVVVASSSQPDHLLAGKIRECQELGVEVSVVPPLYELVNDHATIDRVGALPLLALRATNPSDWQLAIKHGFDRSVALLLLVAVAPLMAAISLALRLASSRPVLVRQRRVGRDGREFDLLGFRTMPEGASREDPVREPVYFPRGITSDDHPTPIGRFLRDTGLEGLPQLINVFRGEMSLIGPRPERPELAERVSRDVSRHRVKSGMTGCAQLQWARGRTSIAERVEWDSYYIQNWSFGLDLRILVLTLVELFRRQREMSEG